ncbi:glycine/D-amino acid oxidase-like deaminating enzyme [Stella humosa]|uniref:Glycine/D-amino acid oxidase-like deaminating enzyme n=1 Tax=Stella humosa TaxID=94 RepID=A0A3N1KWE6_9PROT|nr:FAD-binding oxidoreductase [Stella humosa]ROP83139.1 glycine/D-amino acid oxidase-like deaminating enzyme [Stella humosa]BBK30084.1 hypothetical protein STHU_07180 [Stella humosa]
MTGFSLHPHAPDDAAARLSGALPGQADVVVIGGGIVGASTAWYLARRGLRVVLVERDRIAGQQSGRNWGFVRTQYRDPAELPLAAEALAIWPTLPAELGCDIGWRRSGCIFVAENEEEHATFARWQANARDLAPQARMISADDVAALLPGFTAQVPGALYTPTDGQAEPTLATSAMARAAAAAGACLLEDCGMLAIETTGGRVSGVATEHGRIACRAVVCAAGAQAHRFLAPLGLFLPQQTVRSTVSLTAPLPPIADACFCGLGVGLRQRADGSCILAADAMTDIDLTLDSFRAARHFLPGLLRHRQGFALRLGRGFADDLHQRLTVPPAERAMHPRRPRIEANAQTVARTARRLQAMFPGAGSVAIVKSWAGLIDVLPDALPVIDAPAAVPGLVVATGFSGHGFGLGPAAGRHAAALAAGDGPGAAIAPFRLDRFSLGTYSRPHAPI